MTDVFRHRMAAALTAAKPLSRGKVVGAVGLRVTVSGLGARVGDLLQMGSGPDAVFAEVAALDGDTLSCLPLGPIAGLGAGTPVVSTGGPLRVAVGPDLRGRILDGLGRPMDGGPPLRGEMVSIEAAPPSAMARQLVDVPMPLGVRVLDTLVPCGRGQRIGIFAGSGVGKSTLMSMITRGTSAELNVVALVGERGREVREFIEHDLGEEGLARSVVVIATSDAPPLVRLRAGAVATRIAEYYRDEGKDVLLMMDSVTRAAMAQREVGLSVGEPPATRGYPPSVFAMLASLLERAGPGARGSITGLYTVLVEGDDHNEPIADAARSILDGHIVLSRHLAHANHYPSIDVLESISRVQSTILSKPRQAATREVRALLAAYREAKDLIEIGAYVPGTNPTVDRAVAQRDGINGFLQQGLHEETDQTGLWEALCHAIGWDPVQAGVVA
jgi:flagellum-specific ATP synthase